MHNQRSRTRYTARSNTNSFLLPSLGKAMIHFVLLISRQGKTRLAKWYIPLSQKEKAKIIRETSQITLNRTPKLCNFVEWREYKLVFKRYPQVRTCLMDTPIESTYVNAFTCALVVTYKWTLELLLHMRVAKKTSFELSQHRIRLWKTAKAARSLGPYSDPSSSEEGEGQLNSRVNEHGAATGTALFLRPFYAHFTPIFYVHFLRPFFYENTSTPKRTDAQR
ncbi:AP-1 complex subunit sigma, putative [Plasmodium ovale wallikeri]|uniref:AP-1 complex subunit sigma, putative n=1 Tax=Plasmodium ovale wallikeri TaxID=864142 RepID=A0A1A8YVD5_PLAOA|nr:AP-1 complex subunit sigma, putative [Plasmodium ovale wallikeri]SBT35586.1 AP-1 complex subunit sigma, putative [Plasmodium ovale wallikeri]